MSRRYGIYLAYSPGTDLRNEGLGRLLAEFMRAAVAGEVEWTIACPSWMRRRLEQLFADRGIDPARIDVISPPREPLAVRYLHSRRRGRRRQRPSLGIGRALRALRARLSQAMVATERKILVSDRLLPVVMVYVPTVTLLSLVALLARGGEHLAERAMQLADRTGGRVARLASPTRLYRVLRQPAPEDRQRLYGMVLAAELDRLHDLIAARRDIRAWYSPAAFWPSFNRIDAPRLMCVPDIVATDFPGGFAGLMPDDALMPQFHDLLTALRGGTNFLTYSEDVKWRVLVRGRGVPPQAVTVIRHGANRLDDLVRISGMADNEAATDAYCRVLHDEALGKSIGPGTAVPASSGARYLFYASQARPSKNLLTLLRAYRHLLRDRLVGVRLVLTCNLDHMPQIAAYVAEERLERDVTFLHGLTVRELAACYRLAALAVNPSLSEGGCPFTLSEALSLGTPVVMSRIPVTLEVMRDPGLQAISLFDPYDWRDMARRIEWGLANRAELLQAQLPLYEELAQRSWSLVVAEHVAALDRISSGTEAVA